MHRPSNSTNRLAWLDALRGIAAVMVVVAHWGGDAWPAFYEWAFLHLSVGYAGVILFFAISGFVIPISLSHQPSLRHFWIRRIFRLYPLYWTVLALTVVLRYLKIGGLPPLSTLLMNVTMVPMLVGMPCLLVAFWTLNMEMIFYVSIALVSRMRMNLDRMAIGLALLAAALAMWAHAVVSRNSAGLDPTILLICDSQAVMWTGTLWAGYCAGRVPYRRALLVTTMVMALLSVPGLIWPADGDIAAKASAVGAGLILWLVALGIRRFPVPQVLVRLGAVSYSIYLLHAVIWIFVPRLNNGPTTLLLWSTVLVATVWVSYRFVEQPGILLGRRLTTRHAGNRYQPAASGVSTSMPQ